MTERNKTAKLAGLVYLILVISGILNLMYIPSKLIVWESAPDTLRNIQQSETLFRLGIVSGIITFLAFLVLPLLLYKLLQEVNKTQALLMVVFALVSIPISFVNMLHKFSVLTLISGADYLSKLSTPELEFRVMFELDAYDNGIVLSQIFWGLWLLPFGYLMYKSGFLPRVLGILLMLGCFGYLVKFFGAFLFPDFHKTLIYRIAGLPASIGEISTCLWLLIMGTQSVSFKKAK